MYKMIINNSIIHNNKLRFIMYQILIASYLIVMESCSAFLTLNALSTKDSKGPFKYYVIKRVGGVCQMITL